MPVECAGRDAPGQGWRPRSFSVHAAVRTTPGDDEALADCVCSDVDEGLREFLRVPTIRRYGAVVDPVRHPSASQEVAHQVLASCGADRAAVAAALAHRYRDWRQTLNRASVALDLFDASPADATVPALVGELLRDGAPRFMVGERLSRGSGGAIHACLDRMQHGGSVLPAPSDAVEEQMSASRLVVKFVPAAAGASAESHAEAQWAAKFGARFGTRVVEWGHACPGSDYIVMERVDGLTLSAMAAAECGVDFGAATAELVRLALALSAPHGEGAGHGDITPMNIMMDGGGTFRLIDFGAAGSASPAHDVRSLAAVGLWLSLGYMPPPGSTMPWRIPSPRRALGSASVEALDGSLSAQAFAECLLRHARRARMQRGALLLLLVGGILAGLLYLAEQRVTKPKSPDAAAARSATLAP